LASTTSLLASSRSDVEDLSRSLKEPSWLRERRLAAFDVWERTPMPSRTDEVWRRTDISRVAFDSFEAARDDRPELTPLPEELRQKGVVFTDIASAVREHEALVREHLLTTVTPQDGKFAALHGAFLSSGTFLYVPAGIVVDLPLRTVTQHTAAGTAVFPHTLIVAEKGSEVLLVDKGVSTVAGDAPGFVVATAEVLVREGARVKHAQVNFYGRGVVHFLSHRARIERDAQYVGLVVGFGGKLTKAAIETLLLGPGAESTVLGIVFGEDAQHFDHDTLQDHRAPHTTSRLLFKTALRDQARSIYTGLLRMHKTAVQADASQTNRNLLLSKQAKADSIPKLEIEVNDVKCSHAAASSPVEEEPIFYLMSRGLSRAEAVRMVVEGFFDEVVDRFPHPALAEEIAAALAERLSRE
jgi:Fe-S cluster assembly protein SufD